MKPEPRLCYVDGPWAFFTTQPLGLQWGDDWNDAPYEHNAGEPYSWREGSDKEQWQIVRVAWVAPMETPADRAGYSSGYSVQGINRGDVAWLAPERWGERKGKPIYAGATLSEFRVAIWDAGGEVYQAIERRDGCEMSEPLPMGSRDTGKPVLRWVNMADCTVFGKVIAKIGERSLMGVEKYGTTVGANDLPPLAWLCHLQEELMDAVVYIERFTWEQELRALEGVEK